MRDVDFSASDYSFFSCSEGFLFPHGASDRRLYFIVVLPVIPYNYFVVVLV